MLQKVPFTNLFAMAVTLSVCVLVPVLLSVFLCKKTKGRVLYILVGAVTFIAAVLILESLLQQAVLSIFGERLTGNIWLYAAFGGLSAGLFEETGRYISMRFIMKKDLSKRNALMYGLGHAGAEALLIGGMTYVSNIVITVLINTGRLEPMLAELDGSVAQQVITQYSALWELPWLDFLLAGVERTFAFLLQLCLSYVVYRAVKYRKPMLFVLAVLLHFTADAGLVLLMKKAELPAVAVELVLVVFTVCFTVIVYKKYKAEKEEVPEIREPQIIW